MGGNNGSEHQVTTQQRPLEGAWGITALLFLFMLINFADKVVVGLAAQPIMAELQIDPEKFGITVALNAGLRADVYPTEPEALAWLQLPPDSQAPILGG